MKTLILSLLLVGNPVSTPADKLSRENLHSEFIKASKAYLADTEANRFSTEAKAQMLTVDRHADTDAFENMQWFVVLTCQQAHHQWVLHPGSAFEAMRFAMCVSVGSNAYVAGHNDCQLAL